VNMRVYDLYRLFREEIKNGPPDLVDRQSGQVIRNRIERRMDELREDNVIALDFSKIGVIDYSCADEIIAKLISRLLSGEYGDKYIILIGLNDNQRENIQVALERKDLAVMVKMRDGKKALLGNLNNYLKETLDFILRKNEITAKELSEAMKLEMNTSGTRLLNLHKKRLVKRIDKIRNGGRVWIYEGI
jgi:hypothetical protein